MKQNLDILGTRVGQGQIQSRHVQVIIGFWPNLEPKDIQARTKAWDRWHLLYTVGGRAILTWPGGQLSLLPQTAVLLWPHTEYTYHPDDETIPWDEYSAEFLPRAHWHEWLHWPEIAPGIMAINIKERSANEQIRQAFDKAIAVAETPRPHWEDFAMAMVEMILLEFQAFNEQPKKKQEHADSRLQSAIEFMEQNCSGKITCKEIARVANVSQSYLNVLFQKHLSSTPLNYLNTLRINKAQHLLRETDEPVSQIGRLCGFPNPISFGYRFRKITGHAPGVYRKALK